LFRWSLFLSYAELMVEKNILPKDLKNEYAIKYNLWVNRKGSFNDYVDTVVKEFDANIKGVKLNDFLFCVDEVVRNNAGRTYVFTRNLISELKSEGYFIVAISHSAKLALDKFCPLYGFDDMYGIEYEVKEGVFTGESHNRHLIMNKSNIVKQVLENTNLTFEDSIAVGDTKSDISMLSMVQRPIAFNPSKELYEEALSNGWQVVVERKDVIYKL